jgi:hypothetical protein
LPSPADPASAAVSVHVTSAGGWRPVVVLLGEARTLAPFVERLARAAFATVACDPRSPAELTIVLEALERGDLGVDAASYGVLACGADGSIALSQVRTGARAAGRPLRPVRFPRGEACFEALSKWLLRELT